VTPVTLRVHTSRHDRYSSEPMRRSFLESAEQLSKLLSRHRTASFLITAAGLLLLADAVRQVLSDDGTVGVFTWVALALMAYATITTIRWQRPAPPDIPFLIAWAMGINPALFGIAAALAGSPVVVMWIGVLLAIGLIGWVSVRTPGPARSG
jgi:hypothetical protein